MLGEHLDAGLLDSYYDVRRAKVHHSFAGIYSAGTAR